MFGPDHLADNSSENIQVLTLPLYTRGCFKCTNTAGSLRPYPN